MLTNLSTTLPIEKFKYVEDIGVGKRTQRCRNIAIALIQIFYKLSKEDQEKGNRIVTKDKLRTYIMEKSGQECAFDDARPHGDACGGHGLFLDMEGSGSKAPIFLSKENIKKCVDFLKNEKEEPVRDEREVILD